MQITKKIVSIFFLIVSSNYLFLDNLKANSYLQIDINKDHKEIISFNDQILSKKSLEFIFFRYFNKSYKNKIFYHFSESDGLHQYKKRINIKKFEKKEIYLYTETESKEANIQSDNQFINFTNVDRNLFLLNKIPFIYKNTYLNIFSFTSSTNYRYTFATDPCNLILIDKENDQARYYIDKKIYFKFKCVHQILDINYSPKINENKNINLLKNENKNINLLKFDKNIILIIEILTFILNLFLVRFFYSNVDYYEQNYSIFYLVIAAIMTFLILFYNTLLTLTNYLILIYLLLLNYLKLSKKIKIIISIVLFYFYLLFVFNYDYLYYFGFEVLGNIFILVIIHRLIFFGKPK